MQTAMKLLCTGALMLSGAAIHLAAQEQASTIRACVGPAGAVRIVAEGVACRANETLRQWPTEAAELPSAPAPTPPPAGPSGPRVVNAFGLDLGPLLGPSFTLLTLPTGRKAYAELYPANAPANWIVNQYYQSADCSGEPYVAWLSIEELVPPALVRRSGVWALKPGTLARRTIASRRSVGDSGPFMTTCQPSSGTFDTWQFDFYTPEQLTIVYPLSVQ